MQFDWARGDVILVDGSEVARADRSWFRERAEVQIGPALWLFRAEGSWFRPALVAELDGVRRFGASASGFFTTRWAIDVGDETFEMSPAGIFTSRQVISRAGVPVGVAERSGILTLRSRLELDEPVEVPVGCFLLWVAYIEFTRRQQQSGASGGGAAS